MNIVKFNAVQLPKGQSSIVFCFIDYTPTYTSNYTKELIKNVSDYTISNICVKGYDILQSQNENDALIKAVELGYKHAVVFSTGTEFINGDNFFKEIELLILKPYAIYGHILDREEAYYELHHQCYLINLETYKQLDCPEVGNTELGKMHTQDVPDRSFENIHNGYTPFWVKKGEKTINYKHKLHGWNLISTFLNAGYTLFAFEKTIRDNKKYYYPENQKIFLKNISWVYLRYNFCMTEFIHYSNTETITIDKKFNQIITPASGLWFLKNIDTSKKSNVIFYDYNQNALDYWKNNVPFLENVTYEFVKIDLLSEYNVNDLIKNKELDTLINLSNIFCYESTSPLASLEYRFEKENELINFIPKHWEIIFTLNSSSGFVKDTVDKIRKLKKPTWHYGEWND